MKAEQYEAIIERVASRLGVDVNTEEGYIEAEEVALLEGLMDDEGPK